MNNEILQIISAGINKNPQKVINYSKRLSAYYKDNGNQRFSQKIDKLLDESNLNTVSLDSLKVKPFDKDSHLDIVDVKIPTLFNDNKNLYFSQSVEEEVEDFIQSYRLRNKLMDQNIYFNNNLLLYGPPGSGKTSLATYISNKTNLPLITAKLDSIVSSLLGSTAKNIRKLFEYADSQPCILFLDEFDVLAKNRDDSHELGELKRVVNSLLQNIDSFSNSSILIAATNTPSLLDNAVWRRFDTKIELKLPDRMIRKELVREYLSDFSNNIISNDKQMDILCDIFEGETPANIQNIIVSAIKKCIIHNKNSVLFTDILYECLIHKYGSHLEYSNSVLYLRNYGVTQKDISETLDISVRQVRNVLKEEINNAK
ncbi:AAA family ATPase [Fundicoccus culcitae]|uniref:ATP-binding protein n=1 Tax=Fundicoccus culcitae TaxID=2969821 RepID=A0ABY5P8T8_9LACT|nr:ATP-binding protein [Fundicoccus culcitae]UUX35162.1 ATP-binding protein [Fundicoccus culcitae]